MTKPLPPSHFFLTTGVKCCKWRRLFKSITGVSSLVLTAGLAGLVSVLPSRAAATLILTRRIVETLMIGDDVTVTVLGIKGIQVRIGVNAPKETSVHRKVIYQRIKRERDAKK